VISLHCCRGEALV